MYCISTNISYLLLSIRAIQSIVVQTKSSSKFLLKTYTINILQCRASSIYPGNIIVHLSPLLVCFVFSIIIAGSLIFFNTKHWYDFFWNAANQNEIKSQQCYTCTTFIIMLYLSVDRTRFLTRDITRADLDDFLFMIVTLTGCRYWIWFFFRFEENHPKCRKIKLLGIFLEM